MVKSEYHPFGEETKWERNERKMRDFYKKRRESWKKARGENQKMRVWSEKYGMDFKKGVENG
jgi:hypothetical protein